VSRVEGLGIGIEFRVEALGIGFSVEGLKIEG